MMHQSEGFLPNASVFRGRQDDISSFYWAGGNGASGENGTYGDKLHAGLKPYRFSGLVVQREGDRLKVLFYTFRGVLDNFAGFVYASDDSPPKTGDFGGEFGATRKVEDQWYYVSAR